MSEALFCPHCGGVISGELPEGYSRCRCAGARPVTQVPPAPSALSDRVPAPKPVVEQKVCRVCGIDVSSQKRMKDPQGYICIPCAKAEQKITKPCAECGRRLKPGGIIEYQGAKICRRCYLHHKEAEKFKATPIDMKRHHQMSKRQIVILSSIAFVLLVLIILSSFGVIGRR